MSNSFPSLGVRADLSACLARLGMAEPYPIQSATLPDSLAGGDVLAQSPTGSGKTLAFAIPLVSRVAKAASGHPRALVLAPTRELAAQIANEIRPLAEAAKRRVAVFYGGAGFGEQLSALRRGTDIAVGCPGRLIDLLERRALALDEVEIVVIDEVDRMADMGFMPAVRRLIDEIRGAPQMMFFSATLSKEVERLVRDYQHDPKRFVLKKKEDDLGSRSHELWRAGRENRSALAAEVVSSYGSSLVFCRTKHGVDRLTRAFTQAGLTAVPIHGGRSQAQRDRALAQFRDGQVRVLIGTDVAARGIHVDGIDCVVHFDPPEDADAYLHRSGRTGRAGATGVVISIVTSEQEPALRKLHQHLGLTTEIRDQGTKAVPLAVRPSTPPSAHRRPLPGQDQKLRVVAGREEARTGAAGAKGRPSRRRRPNTSARGAGFTNGQRTNPTRQPNDAAGSHSERPRSNQRRFG